MTNGLRFIALLLVISLTTAPPAHAGEPSEQEIRASNAFAAQLRKARTAVQKGDAYTVKIALRQAMRAGRWQLEYAESIPMRPVNDSPLTRGVTMSRCSVPFFSVPLWTLVAQVRNGDPIGARETALRLTDATDRLATLCLVARLQAGRNVTLKEPSPEFEPLRPNTIVATMRKETAAEREQRQDREEELRYKDADYSVLMRPPLTPNRAEAIKTLRHALRYALALRRHYYSLEYLLKVQKEIGDKDGIRETLRLMKLSHPAT